eukprot:GHVN01092032.1.p1 GENE.GHVN01092032.1~~GHVN01092032.1.p1  ORF type:complete len:141 (-),score=7.58 GHVN01092032.1:400-822(-)
MSLKFWKFFVVWAMSCMQAYAVVDRFCCHDCTSHMVIGAPIWIRGTLWCSSHVCHHQEACLPGMSTGGMLSSPSKPITKQFSLCQWPSQQPYERYNKRSNPSSHISLPRHMVIGAQGVSVVAPWKIVYCVGDAPSGSLNG